MDVRALLLRGGRKGEGEGKGRKKRREEKGKGRASRIFSSVCWQPYTGLLPQLGDFPGPL